MSLKDTLSKVKQADLCALLGVTDRTIQRWHEQGLPRHGEGRGCTYVWEEVLAWYVAFVSGSRGGGQIGDRERKLKAEADLAEMEAAEQAKELLRASEVRQAWTSFLGRIKVNLDGLPDRAAQGLEDGMNLAERAAVIRRELNSIRHDLAVEAGDPA